MKAEQLKEWRESMGYTQADFCRIYIKQEMGEPISCSILSQWETGKRPVPRWMAMLKYFKDEGLSVPV